MGTDIPRIVESFRAIHEIWATILDISIAAWLLERQLSIACVAPVVVSISMFGGRKKLFVSENDVANMVI